MVCCKLAKDFIFDFKVSNFSDFGLNIGLSKLRRFQQHEMSKAGFRFEISQSVICQHEKYH